MKLQAYNVLILKHSEKGNTEIVGDGPQLILAKDQKTAELKAVKATDIDLDADNFEVIVRPF